MMRDYEVLEDEFSEEGHHLIKLTSGEFSGIIYTYGGMRFIEEGDQCRLNFDYDIVNNSVENIDREGFEVVIGNILLDILQEQLAKHETVYTGGIDENRTTDSEQSDS